MRGESTQMIVLRRVSTRRGQLREGDRPWGGSPRMRCVSAGLNQSPSAAFPSGPARLRTETSYKAGSVRRASTTGTARSVGPKPSPEDRTGQWRACSGTRFLVLSGEICTFFLKKFRWCSHHRRSGRGTCPTGRNGRATVRPGGAEVSRGRSTECDIPLTTGRTEQ